MCNLEIIIHLTTLIFIIQNHLLKMMRHKKKQSLTPRLADQPAYVSLFQLYSTQTMTTARNVKLQLSMEIFYLYIFTQ